MSDAPLLSVVVPVYNAAAVLPQLYRQTCRVLEKAEIPFELLFVDDASRDESLAVLRALAQADARVKVVAFSRNCGQQEATLCGIARARGRYIANMDDDLQHPPAFLPVLLRRLCNDRLDIVYGVPAGLAGTPVRRVGGALRDGLFFMLYGKNMRVRVSSFRVMRRALAKRVLAQRGRFNYFSAMVFARPVRAASLPYPYRAATQSHTGYSLAARVALYGGILLHYGPLGPVIKAPPAPWPVKEVIGFGN
ncbi:glycosyltransferase family 2 protein [Ruminococcaceae bacterium OttesenSCG-928-O06]|nr:glycosyltransferase family 2 protein [Ruminococcaceae bacterium OttesenSCG-928-O06]